MSSGFRPSASQCPRVAGDGAQRPLLAPPADHDGRVRLLDRGGIAKRLAELIVLSLEIDLALGPPRPEQAGELKGLLQPLEPFADAGKRDAQRPVFQLEPGAPQAEIQPPPADDVDRRRHLGQNGRMTVRDSTDQDAEADPLCQRRQRGEDRPAVHAGPLRASDDGEEMIEDPDRIVAQVFRLQGDLHQLGVGDVLLRDLNAESGSPDGEVLGAWRIHQRDSWAKAGDGFRGGADARPRQAANQIRWMCLK